MPLISGKQIDRTRASSRGTADDKANLVVASLSWAPASRPPRRPTGSAAPEPKIYGSRGNLLNAAGLGSIGIGWKASSWLVKSSAKGRWGRRRGTAVKMWTMNCETNFRGKDFQLRGANLDSDIDIKNVSLSLVTVSDWFITIISHLLASCMCS